MRKGNYVVYDAYTGQKVDLFQKLCPCGHSITFLSNRSRICSNCGRKVYPTDKCEFLEKLEVERKKRK